MIVPEQGREMSVWKAESWKRVTEVAESYEKGMLKKKKTYVWSSKLRLEYLFKLISCNIKSILIQNWNWVSLSFLKGQRFPLLSVLYSWEIIEGN